jgi:hypothetical protein
MSEQSLPAPEAQDEQPQQKSSARATRKAAKKATKKSAAKKPAQAAPEKEPDKAVAEDSGTSAADQTPAKQARRGRTRGRGRQDKAKPDEPKEPKVDLDDKKVAKRAWKIFLGEVNEEGLALVADKDARELARRSLRIAEIYTQEEVLVARKNKGKGSK